MRILAILIISYFSLLYSVGIALAPVAAAGHAQATTDDPQFSPFGEVTVEPDFELNGEGQNVDSIAFWLAPDAADTLMFVTAKNNQLVEVWQYPFVDNELPPLEHASFGDDTRVNGVAVDQETDQLYIAVSDPVATVSVFGIPGLSFVDSFIDGKHELNSEPNIALLEHENGEEWAYVSSNNSVYIYDALTGTPIEAFEPSTGLETMLADNYYQILYIPDENDQSGVYAYHPDGRPYERNGSNRFGEGQFDSDAEGILLFTCPAGDASDDDSGFLVVADQRGKQTDFEFFDRETWAHLGTMNIAGVANTDGIASLQAPLPDYPLGLFAAIHDDTSTVGVGWDKILEATGLSCADADEGGGGGYSLYLCPVYKPVD